MTYGVTPEELADVLREAARRVGRCDDVFIVLLSKSSPTQACGKTIRGCQAFSETAIGAESCQRVDTATACRRVGAARAAQVAPITSHIIAWFACEETRNSPSTSAGKPSIRVRPARRSGRAPRGSWAAASSR